MISKRTGKVFSGTKGEKRALKAIHDLWVHSNSQKLSVILIILSFYQTVERIIIARKYSSYLSSSIFQASSFILFPRFFCEHKKSFLSTHWDIFHWEEKSVSAGFDPRLVHQQCYGLHQNFFDIENPIITIVWKENNRKRERKKDTKRKGRTGKMEKL